MIKVSVIIPIYNNAATIQRCLESVMSQSMADAIEIICVDDGSTDASKDIVKELIFSRFVLLEQEHSGSGTARNKGIECAKGEFIMFVDGDDILYSSQAIEALYYAAVSNKALICGGNIVRLSNNRVMTRFEKDRALSSFRKEGFIYTENYQYPYGYTRYLFNRELIVENRVLFPALLRGQDIVFCVKALSLVKEFYHINVPVYINVLTARKKFNKRMVYDFEESITNTILISRNLSWNKLEKLMIKRLRIFAMTDLYNMVDCSDDWNRIDWDNHLLSKDQCRRALLTYDEWSRKGIRYLMEFVYCYGCRTLDFIYKKLIWTFSPSMNHAIKNG